MAIEAAKAVMDYDHATHVKRDRVKGVFTPGRALFVDVEDSFDMEWALAHGWDDKWHHVAKPAHAEQAIDVVTSALDSNVFDLIIVDSIAALAPSKELEESTEDWQMGLGARLTNKAMRIWPAKLIEISQKSRSGGPVMLCMNQFRLKLGVMFGDPRTMPNGKGQEFAANIIVYTKSSKVIDDSKDDHGIGEYGGLVYKNKTFVSKCNYTYRMALKNLSDGTPKGQIDNTKQMMSLGKSMGLIVDAQPPNPKGWQFGPTYFKTLKEIESRFETDPAFRTLMWRSVISAFGGTPS
jgi:RecA/RadA recombinase